MIKVATFYRQVIRLLDSLLPSKHGDLDVMSYYVNRRLGKSILGTKALKES